MGNNITQKLKYKESVVKFAYKYGVTKASIKFCECRRTIYRWRKEYNNFPTRPLEWFESEGIFKKI